MLFSANTARLGVRPKPEVALCHGLYLTLQCGGPLGKAAHSVDSNSKKDLFGGPTLTLGSKRDMMLWGQGCGDRGVVTWETMKAAVWGWGGAGLHL